MRLLLIITIITLSLNSIICFSADEKGKVFIQNYTQKLYRGHPQNWSIVQDERGIMYFGNGDGILEYDGVTWRMIVLPNKSTARSLRKDRNGRIYVGSVGDFGYLASDSNETMGYFSLMHLVSEDDKEFQDIMSIFINYDTIYFRSVAKVFNIIITK